MSHLWAIEYELQSDFVTCMHREGDAPVLIAYLGANDADLLGETGMTSLNAVPTGKSVHSLAWRPCRPVIRSWIPPH